MKSLKLTLVALIAAVCGQTAQADIGSYSQNFETLDQTDPLALGNDGWDVFANVFDAGGNYLYGYGPFDAPNGGEGFSGITVGEGGAGGQQGNQHMVTYSDYANGDHGVGNLIEANVFQERTISAADVGNTVSFMFDANNRDLAAPTTALAFIKTLDPNAGFALTNFVTVDTTNLTDWESFELQLAIDGSLDGQLIQFGFANTATNFNSSGVNYDNVSFGTNAIPEPGTAGLMAVGLIGLAARRRRR